MTTSKPPLPLRWGFFGAGNITFDFVSCVNTLDRSKHLPVAIAARDLQRAKEFATENKLVKAYDSYEELAQDPEIDIIYIGTINSEHFDHIKLAFAHGKHVLCEKPLCLNAWQAKEVVRLARQTNLFLMEGFWTRFLPSIKYFEEYIGGGGIGELKQILSGYGGPNTKDRLLVRELGGGVCLNYGVYGIQYATHFFGKPDKISACGHLADTGVDVSAMVSLLYDDGQKIATFSASCNSQTPNFLAFGTKGRLTMGERAVAPIRVETPDGIHHFDLPKIGVKFKSNPYAAGLIYEAEEVWNCIAKGKLESENMPLDESVLIAEITDEVRRQLGVVYPQDKKTDQPT